MPLRLSRPRTLALCALPVLALFGTAAFAPLPFTLAQPGTTANVLGAANGKPVITITGAPTRTTEGQLRMTTIVATGPTADVRIGDVVDGWFRTDRAVMSRNSVYPTGGSEKQIEQHNLNDMKESQDVAVDAALNYLDREQGPMRFSSTSVTSVVRAPASSSPSASSTSSTGTAPAATSPGAAPSPVRAPSRRTARSAPSAGCP